MTHPLLEVADRLTQTLSRLRFDAPITHVYHPHAYARRAYQLYLERYAPRAPRVILLGMNPGPFGMAQTGIPFGDMPSVRDWIKIRAAIDKPECEHPKRPVLGFDTPRREVSGQRLWGWAQTRFGEPEAFFSRFFVYNYCPLAFMDSAGRNITPDKLKPAERTPLLEACDAALIEIARYFPATAIVGIGRFAEQCAKRVFAAQSLSVMSIPHPSPASPQANRGWAEAVDRALHTQGLI